MLRSPSAALPIAHLALRVLLVLNCPFVAANTQRLEAIAWVLLALQVLSIVIGGIGKAISTAAHPVHLGAGFSTSGWLAVLLTFVLARVFGQAALMREDLAGTI